MIFRDSKHRLRGAFYTVGALKPVLRLSRFWRGKGAIVGYHRVLPDRIVAEDDSPNRELAISISRFEEQMRYLAENHHVVTMDELVQHIKQKHDRFVVAVTFDDGYRDNFVHALPILERYSIPATVFVTTGFLEGDTIPWWPELWNGIANQDTLEIDLSEGIRFLDLRGIRNKNRAFKKLHRRLISITAEKQRNLLDQFDNGATAHSFDNGFLSWAELREMSGHSLIEIGGHTKSHPNLAALNSREARTEIEISVKQLEQRLGLRIRHFAYPYGGRAQASVREYQICRDLGIVGAVTTECRPLNEKSNPLAMPRHCIINEHDLSSFIAKLSGWNTLWASQA